MAQGVGGFIKENLKSAGKIGAAFGVAEVAMAENKLKGIASALATILTFKAGMAAMFVGTFSKAKDSMSNLIKESGSLDAALRRIGKAAEDAGNAYAKAKDNMKAGAGAAWAESEITNTKNMTRAVEAMTPAVTAASNNWAKLSGGLSTAKSSMIRAAAESGILGSAITIVSNSVASLAIGASALATPALVKWLFQAGAAAQVSSASLAGMTGTAMRSSTALNTLTRLTGISRAAFAGFGSSVLRVVGALARLSGIGVIASAIAAVVGVAWSYVKAWQEAGNASNRMLDAALDSTRAIAAQVAMIKTAEDQARAYANALDELAKAHQQWIAVKSSGKKDDSQEMKAADTARKMAEDAVRRAAAATPTEGPGSGTEPAVLAARTARAQSDAALEDRIANASEEAKPELLREKARIAAERAATGASETAGRSDTQMTLNDISIREMNAKQLGEQAQKDRDDRIAVLNGQLVQSGEESNTASKVLDYIPGSRTAGKVMNSVYKFGKEKKIRDEIASLKEANDRGEGRYNPQKYSDERQDALEASKSEYSQLEGDNMRLQKYRGGMAGGIVQSKISANAARMAILAEDMGSSVGNDTVAKAGTAEANRADIRATEAKSIADIERDIANAKEEGYDLSVKESEARRAILEAQLKTEVSMGRGKGLAAESIRTQIIKSKKEDEIRKREHEAETADADNAVRKSFVYGDGYEAEREKQESDLRALTQKEVIADRGTDKKAKDLAWAARKEQENKMENSKRAHEAEVRGTQASAATSAITGAGYGVDRQKAAIERERLVKDKAAASGDTAKARVQASIDAHDAGEREAGVAGFQKGRGIRSELEQSSARVRGDSAAITAGVNFDEFKGKMDSLRNDVGTQKAAEIAGTLSRDAITLRARNDMNSSNAGVASASMARIGGGGGIGPGATSMIDISKQIKDLSIEANRYLAEMLALEKKKGGIPAR